LISAERQRCDIVETNRYGEFTWGCFLVGAQESTLTAHELLHSTFIINATIGNVARISALHDSLSLIPVKSRPLKSLVPCTGRNPPVSGYTPTCGKTLGELSIVAKRPLLARRSRAIHASTRGWLSYKSSTEERKSQVVRALEKLSSLVGSQLAPPSSQSHGNFERVECDLPYHRLETYS
jgi:hypothetical protein